MVVVVEPLDAFVDLDRQVDLERDDDLTVDFFGVGRDDQTPLTPQTATVGRNLAGIGAGRTKSARST
jgi:hypothetical protein